MPNSKPVSKKPLVEAIFELKWQLNREKPDESYPLFIGRLYDRLEKAYPVHKTLPSSLIPYDVALYVVQHQFRATEEGWPLVQIGPGIVTLNDTDSYSWNDFGKRVKSLVDCIYGAYPDSANLKISSLVLRYIDAFPLGSTSEDIIKFLSTKLKVQITFPAQLFEDVSVQKQPGGVNLLTIFPLTHPKGTISIRFGNGRHDGQPAILMETSVNSGVGDIPNMPDNFADWVESAHTVVHNWFFKFIAGELEKEFTFDKQH